jgi:hypothetical protein
LDPLWSHTLPVAVRGLSLARETSRLLARDARGGLTLLDPAGNALALRHFPPAPILVADIADDGSAVVAGDERATLAMLGPDLQIRWERTVLGQPLAVAVESFGRLVALASTSNNLTVYDGRGRLLWRTETPRPLLHLAFVPEQALLVGSADFGLVMAFDPAGQSVWRDGLVAHVGSLAVTGSGRSALACFSAGLQWFEVDGRRAPVTEAAPCRLADLSYDGAILLTVGPGSEVSLRKRDGGLTTWASSAQPTAAALDALVRMALVGLADGRVVALDTGLSPR